MARKRRPAAAPRPPVRRSLDEPRDDDVELFDHPDGPHLVIDYTAGGLPIGVPYEPIREEFVADARRSGAGWAIARDAMLRALRAAVGRDARVEVGRVTHLGRGLSRHAYRADVEVDCENPSGFVALVPAHDADADLPDRVMREQRLLSHLSRLDLPFRVPRPVAIVSMDDLVLVEEELLGVGVDMRAGVQPTVRPWDVLASVAGAVHRIEPPSDLPGHATRRAHALADARVFGQLDDPLAAVAHAWIEHHLPPDTPASLVHGDLLGKNVLIAPDQPPGVIDWEYARRGDPAYELAILTRGARRPFELPRGLDKLVCAYRAAGGEVCAEDVRVYELCLVGRWLAEALRARNAHEITMHRAALERLLGPAA
ncbi:MAG: phosphotransferase [Deltaproteobacteria bacterium]|nr:phosphotransferase [Deltaproteobacteria bacterium]